MSNWNQAIGKVIMTAPVDVTTAVYAERARVKVGHACSPDRYQNRMVQEIYGFLESVNFETIWNTHQRLCDKKYQEQISSGKIIESTVQFLFQTRVFSYAEDSCIGCS